jgi:hypothetical protein
MFNRFIKKYIKFKSYLKILPETNFIAQILKIIRKVIINNQFILLMVLFIL